MSLPPPFQAGPFASDAEYQAFKTAEEAEASVQGWLVHVQQLDQGGSIYASVSYAAPPGVAAAAASPASAAHTAAGLAGAAVGAAAGAAVGGPVAAAVGAAIGSGLASALVGSNGWQLGELSRRYEVGLKGPDTVSSGAGDNGGASYGLYQMSSLPGGGTVARFVKTLPPAQAALFVGQVPGEAGFTQAWKQLAASDPSGFSAAQQAFIKTTHYDPVVQRVTAAARVAVPSRSRALQDVVWSSAVQHGGFASDIVIGCCQAVEASGLSASQTGTGFDQALIKAVYAERGRKDLQGILVHFASSSSAVQAGVSARFVKECADALQELGS